MKCTRCKKEIDTEKNYMTLTTEYKREKAFCYECGELLDDVDSKIEKLSKIRREFLSHIK